MHTLLASAGLEELTARLWDIEIVAGAAGVAPQLTTGPVLLVLLSGSGRLKRDTDAVPMRRDTAYFAPAYSTFGFDEGRDGTQLAVIRFELYRESSQSRGVLLSDRAQQPVFQTDGVTLRPAGRLSALCRTLWEQRQSGDALLRGRTQLTFQELLYEVVHNRSERSADKGLAAAEQAKAYIDAHYGEDLNIERLAGIVRLSPKSFADAYKKHYGISAPDYLARVRISRAKRLMLGSDMKLKDIAHEVGYEDEFYFSRKFRKSVGLSPTAYIKKRKTRLAAYGSPALLGYLLPLNIIPAAAPLHPKWTGYYYNQLGTDIAVHLDAFRNQQNQPANLPALAEMKPELIMCPAGLEPKKKASLSGLAELYELPAESEGWRAGLRAVAQRLDEREEAERFIDAFEWKAARIRRKLAPVLRTTPLLPLRLLKGQFYVHCNRGITDVLFDSLGASFSYSQASMPFDAPISLEELDQAGDGILLLLICQETETLQGWKTLSESPEWLSLRAVREKRVKIIPSDPWREYSPSALDRMLDSAEALFAAKHP